jgi:hypothetical protein
VLSLVDMSVSGLGNKSKRKKGTAENQRRSAIKDALPDSHPAGQIKKIREVEEPAAENDEEDD